MKIGKKGVILTSLLTFSLSLFLPFNTKQDNEYNASMVSQSVRNLFDELVDSQGDGCLNNYATVYFSNLNNKFPINSHGTCSLTALSMYLSFYDAYWDDDFVDLKFEENAIFESDESNGQSILVPSYKSESPGLVSENVEYVQNMTESQYREYLSLYKDTYFQGYLMELSYQLFGNYGLENSENPFGMTMYEQARLLYYYMVFKRGISTNRAIAYSLTNNNDEDLEADVKDLIIRGIPVVINISSPIFGNHTVIAYDYDSYNNRIYVHTGWKDNCGNALTHVSLNRLNATIESAIVIETTNTHHLSGRYFCESSCVSSFSFGFPRNLLLNNSYYDIAPTFKWDSMYEEKWFYYCNQFIEFTILNHYKEVIFRTNIYSGNKYTLYEDIWRMVMIGDTHDDYYVQLQLKSDGGDDIPYNKCLKLFDKPKDYLNVNSILIDSNDYTGYRDYYEDSEYYKNNFINHVTSNGYCFKTRRYRAGYIHNECVVLSPKRKGYQEAFIEYQFLTPIDRMDIELSFWREKSYEGLTNSSGKATIEVFKYGEYDTENPVLDLLDQSTQLPENRNIKRTYNICFETPTTRIRIYAKINNQNSNSDNRGRICIGKVKLYENPGFQPQFDLPTNGSELEFDQMKWNNGRVWNLNCYNYALNSSVYYFMQPGEYGYYFNNQGLYNNYVSSDGSHTSEYFSKEVLESMVSWDSLNIVYEFSNKTKVGFMFGEIGEYDVCPIGTYKVALVLDLNQTDMDYHWYRQNNDGSWSHKSADYSVINWDYYGNPIYNPKYCDRRDYYTGHNYSTFVGFYYVSPFNIND